MALDWAESAANMFQPTKRCQATIRSGQHCGMAVSDGDYCRFHGGQRESRMFAGAREITDDPTPHMSAVAIRSFSYRLPAWRGWLIRLLAR